MKKKKRNRYTEQFRTEAVRVVEGRGNRTIADVAEGLGISTGLLQSWKLRAAANPVSVDNDRGETPPR